MKMSFFSLPLSLKNLIEELEKLPGVGPKTAQRLAYYLLQRPDDEVKNLARVLTEAVEKVVFCSLCFNFAEGELCEICRDQGRDKSIICVVEEPKDVLAIEKTRQFKGVYHVLHGSISPLEGKGPEDLRLTELLERVKKGNIKEVILATNPNLEGETTALYLARLLKAFDVKTTRLASGLPHGSDLDFADEITLGRALEGRLEI